MATSRAWAAYSPTYRRKEMAVLARWIQAGQSGAVVGLPGCGRSNLLGFLCHRPEIFRSYLSPQADPVILIPVDLNNLPTQDLSTLYRVVLRSFYMVRHHFEPSLQQAVTELYRENRAEQDPFLPQSALHELLLLFQAQQIQVALVFNHFDRFCEQATPQMLNTLRGLRDSFKDTLCYIVGMSQEAAYLPDSVALGDMYILLDRFVCWVGPMVEADARQVIAQEISVPLQKIAEAPVEAALLMEEEIGALLVLTGGFPALLKATCHWWLTLPVKPPVNAWANALLAEHTLQYRLEEIWQSLTQEEQLVLAELQKLQARSAAPGGPEARDPGSSDKAGNPVRLVEGLKKQYEPALTRLTEKGLCRKTESGWGIAGDLLAAYIAQVEGRSRGKIWLDHTTGEFFQGQTLLEGFTALERAVLSFLVKHPRERHPKSVLIDHAWPEEFLREGITDDSLFQVVKKLRQKIEPLPARPCYLVTWRGQPEGGYQFFPEGRPG